ncbi:M81 family metallopeptidase [Marivita cryptomonadis]|uniref:M81 family metallopeptidase n=1 Tax=Marivita cryptomonadis TaxID=505252 RepID=UPI000A1EC85D|nr:M81 family metallopeptidase [Marivita cryptomonadis]
MKRILIAGCEQEISSFNPLPSRYEDFSIAAGEALIAAHSEADSCISGFLDSFSDRTDLTLVPVIAAAACSAGPLSAEGFERLSREILTAIDATTSDGVDAIYLSLHGAMGAIDEPDPEGFLLESIRAMVGPDAPIVISLDLHGILTDRMLRNCDAIAVFHTYPHNDFTSTGQRAARLMKAILDIGARPVMARIFIPALVRGPELITETGLYGKIIDRAKTMEDTGEALSAAVLIGNPFTDAPELGSQSLVITDNDPVLAERLALELAQAFWRDHEHMLADLVPLPDALAEIGTRRGPFTLTDAADAISSGASGDSNAILAGLVEANYAGSALIPIVDAPAAAKAHAAGLGARLRLSLGGTVDPKRFPPLELMVEVESLWDGKYTHEVSRMPVHAGPTAVLKHDNIRIIVVTQPVFMMDRAIFLAHGLDPETADIIAVKSPGAAVRYFTFAKKNFVLDIPGSTSANLPSLGHSVCSRPMFPLDDHVTFEPVVQHYPLDERSAA